MAHHRYALFPCPPPFPVLDIDLGPRWELNVGVGAGLTPATDRLIVKAILGYRFGPMPEPTR